MATLNNDTPPNTVVVGFFGCSVIAIEWWCCSGSALFFALEGQGALGLHFVFGDCAKAREIGAEHCVFLDFCGRAARLWKVDLLNSQSHNSGIFLSMCRHVPMWW